MHFEDRKYDLAEAEMREALAMAQTYSDASETMAYCLHELGWLLYFTGKYHESEPFLLRALELSDVVNGRSHDRTVRLLSAIARLYQHAPDVGKDPEPYFRQAVEASKSNPELQNYYYSDLCRLGGFLEGAGRFDDADVAFTELLPFVREISSKGYSNDWWIVSSCVKYFTKREKQDLLVGVATNQVTGGDAYSHMVSERLEAAELTLADDDADLIEALLNAGNNEMFEGKYHEAERLLDRAASASAKTHGENGYKTLLALSRVCVVKRLLAKFDEAESAIQRAVAGAKQHFPNDKIYPSCLQNLALLREAEKKTDDAVKIYSEAVAEHEKIFGFPSYETAEALYRHSGFLLRVEKVAAAEIAIRRAISAMDDVAELSGYEKSDYLATLASILEATGRSTEAQELQARAEKLLQESRQDYENLDV